MIVDVVFWILAVLAVFSAWRVFRTDSMVRAAYWLLISFVGVGFIMVMLKAEFLGVILILMMGGEMTIMAVFMVMFMMNPAGLNPMIMVHQNRAAMAAGFGSFGLLSAVGLFARFPASVVPPRAQATAELGTELLGDSMLVFQTAGVTLLAAMIGAVALVSVRGRFGRADEGSDVPEQRPAGSAAADPGPSVSDAAAAADGDVPTDHSHGHAR
ncbi:MAG: NADH-quinone oxidoreductase subunit J family protein [Thermoleophilia bacterium]